MELAPEINNSLYNLHLHGWGRKTIVVLFVHMDGELMSESADGHGPNICIGYLSLNTVEKSHKSAIGKDVVEILCSQDQNSFLFFIDMVDLGQFRRQKGFF